MKIALRNFVWAGALLGALLLANSPAVRASDEVCSTPAAEAAYSSSSAGNLTSASAGSSKNYCYTYQDDVRYCNVVKINDGVCVHKRWGQSHDGQFGNGCFCYDTVDNSQDFLVDHYTTPLSEGCYPYNDCQFGTVYTCLY